jgi:hypothetical protein
MSAQWKGALTGSITARLAPRCLASSAAPLVVLTRGKQGCGSQERGEQVKGAAPAKSMETHSVVLTVEKTE